MPKIKLSLSPSKIEQFRKFRDEEMNGYITEEKVIESVMGTQVWSEQMTTGTAYHAVIEHGHERYFNPDTGLYEVWADERSKQEFVPFTWNEIEPAVKYRASYPGMLFEIPLSYVLDLGEYEVTMNMRIDAMHGLWVHEHKTLYNKSLDHDSYESYIQWKIYMLRTGAHGTKYNIFEHKKGVKDIEARVTHHQFSLHPYPTMLNDIKEATMGLIDFCKNKDLMKHVYSKERQAAF